MPVLQFGGGFKSCLCQGIEQVVQFVFLNSGPPAIGIGSIVHRRKPTENGLVRIKGFWIGEINVTRHVLFVHARPSSCMRREKKIQGQTNQNNTHKRKGVGFSVCIWVIGKPGSSFECAPLMDS
jgi:hypothetical protein